jgi:hypothetical protein
MVVEGSSRWSKFWNLLKAEIRIAQLPKDGTHSGNIQVRSHDYQALPSVRLEDIAYFYTGFISPRRLILNDNRLRWHAGQYQPFSL